MPEVEVARLRVGNINTMYKQLEVPSISLPCRAAQLSRIIADNLSVIAHARGIYWSYLAAFPAPAQPLNLVTYGHLMSRWSASQI